MSATADSTLFAISIVLDPSTAATITLNDTVRGKVLLDVHSPIVIELVQIHFQGLIHTRVPRGKSEEEHIFFYLSQVLLHSPELSAGSSPLLPAKYTYDFQFSFPQSHDMECDVPFGPTSSDIKYGHVKDRLPSTMDVSEDNRLGRICYELLTHASAKTMESDDVSLSVSRELKLLNNDLRLADAVEPLYSISVQPLELKTKKRTTERILQATTRKSFLRKVFSKSSKGETLPIYLLTKRSTQYVKKGEQIDQDLKILMATTDLFSKFTSNGGSSNGLVLIYLASIEVTLLETLHFRANFEYEERTTVHELLKKEFSDQPIDLMKITKSGLVNLKGEKLNEVALPEDLLSGIKPVPTLSKSFDLCTLDRTHRLDIHITLKPERGSKEKHVATVNFPVVVLDTSERFRYRNAEEMQELERDVMKQMTELTYLRSPAV
jgi:hypothetical protein